VQPHDDSVKLVGRIEALEHSVSVNPALLTSWSELERLYRAAGDTHKAEHAARHRATLEQLPPPIVAAGRLFSEGNWAAAKRALHGHSDHMEARRLLGRIAHQGGQLTEAASQFEAVLRAVPGYRAARADYARTLIEQQRHTEAQQQLAALLELEPDNGDYRVLSAIILAGLGQHERAITTYQRVLTNAPGWVHLYLLLGNSLKAMGRQQEAIDAYRAAAARRPAFGDAWWSLANLKTHLFSDVEVRQMRALSGAPTTSVVDRYHLCFALGKALEDRADYADSWRCYELGNRLRAMHAPYDVVAMERKVDRLVETYTAEHFARQAQPYGLDPDRTPIFIVGLPRSGSTLVEQILASHSCVEGTQELPVLSRLVREGRLSGEKYLADTRAYCASGKPVFIDKMPGNFWHIGPIHLMLPHARIIDVRRDPLACCVSNLKQLYAAGNEYTYSVDTLARYYKSYVRLMKHWDEVLPGRVLHIAYEDLVEDLETTVARLLRFCGLNPEAGCLQFYRTDRAVNTASSEQVRQPVFRRGLTEWQHFEPWLGALREALA
jgi:tetratricopeptide (TPR) repeat protein